MRQQSLYRILFLLPLWAWGQSNGVQFVKDTSWNQVVNRAKKENKKILVDCYTTWCVWCKWLDNRVFPLSYVGDSINAKYVPVQIQFDTSIKDNEYVKSWYYDARILMKAYNITAFPTQLFFDENGLVLGKCIGVDSKQGPSGYLSMVNNANIPEKQYFSLLRKYENGDRNLQLMKDLSIAGFIAGEYKKSDSVFKEYLSLTNKLPMSLDKINFIANMTHGVKDTGFQILYNGYYQMDHLLNEPIATSKVREEIYFEIANPFIFRGKGQVEGLRYYLNEPDWVKLESKIKKYYPKFVNEVLLYSKLEFYNDQRNWDKFAIVFTKFIAEYNKRIDTNTLAHIAENVYLNCDRRDLLTIILDEIQNRSDEKLRRLNSQIDLKLSKLK